MYNQQTRLRQLVMTSIAAGFLTACAANASNLRISNVVVLPIEGNSTNALVQFDVSWENSWRFYDLNHDAAWVFFKVQDQSVPQQPWRHVTLVGTGINDAYHLRGTQVMPVDLIVPDDAKGMFMRRSGEGAGKFEAKNVRARWDLSTLGLDDQDEIVVRAYGVEMVYVPAGSFWVGSGGSESGTMTEGSWTTGTSFPFRVTSGATIELKPSAGGLWSTGTSDNENSFSVTHGQHTIPAHFPTGTNAFYCMKYMVTQGQYRDFLNSLTRDQQNAQTVAHPGGGGAITISADAYIHTGARVGIRNPSTIPVAPEPIVFGCDLNGNGVFDEADDGENIAMAFMSNQRNNRIIDWMALRPMTELEYEKAARGTNAPVADEYPWGTDTGSNLASISDSGKGTEVADSNDRNMHVNNNAALSGPTRAGIFAFDGATRVQAGASYYGIMDMGGPLGIFTVSLGAHNSSGSVLGLDFIGNHGDGELTSDGQENQTTWPYTGASWSSGYGLRGGVYNRSDMTGRISCRRFGSWRAFTGDTRNGTRAVRTAPAVAGP